MYIPEEKVSEILDASDIVDVISESVVLKQSGKNYLGLCPFHSEKTPSFSVSPQKQIFHCFGCAAGGNAFSFLMRFHGISFPEAANMLAAKHNITIETKGLDPARKKAIETKETLFRINREVMTYYQKCLLENPKAAARKYLKNRSLSQKMIEKFHIGYAEDSWDSIVNQLERMGVGKDPALKSGLIIPRKNATGYYDRFRNRIIFPIFDVNMQVAGFGGRVMDDTIPKYLNSPETPVYNKKKILYGLHESKSHCRQKGVVYIVEGYLDFLSLFQNGIKNVVATLGTALTKEHVRLIKGYVQKAILVFDSDQAGINAAKRSISIFSNEGVEVKILVLPQGKDPDSYVTEQGRELFEKKASGALSVIDFLIETAVDKYGLSIEGRVAVVDEMKSYISQIHDSAARSLYIKELSERLDIDERAVLEKVKEAYVKTGEKVLRTSGSDAAEKGPESERREKQLLSILLQNSRIREEVKKSKVLDCFLCDRFKNIGLKALSFDSGCENILTRMMLTAENETEREFIASLAMEDLPESDSTFEKSVFLIKRIMKLHRKRDNTLLRKIKEAENLFDSEVVDLLCKKQKEIMQLHEKK